MAQAPIIVERRPVGSLNLPRQRVTGGERAFGALGEFGQVLEAAQEQQNDIELKRRGIELETRLDQLKEEVKVEPDFLKREELFRNRAREVFDELSSEVENSRVRSRLGNFFSLAFPRKAAEFTRENQTEAGFARVAEADKLAETIAAKAARTTDPAEIARDLAIIRDTYDKLSTGPFAPLNADQAQNKISAFEKQVQFGAALQAARTDPIGTINNLAERFPKLDAREMETVFNRAASHQRKLEREEEAEQKEMREMAELELAIAASQNKLPITELPARARQFGLKAEDFRQLQNDIEKGGVSDPDVVLRYEALLKSGRPVSLNDIVGHPEINRDDKSQLLTMLGQLRDEKHFSKTPEYQEAAKELRIAVTRKGPFETLDPQEQKLLLFATRQLFDRVQSGENPISVSREIINRIPEEQGGAVGLPDLNPKFESEEDLRRALQEGRIGRTEFAQEALLFKRKREKERQLQEIREKAKKRREER